MAELRARADIVFGPTMVAVFIDGCFWHCCPDHFRMPRTNTDYWAPKFARNRERDADSSEALSAAGWLVLRFWEHEAAADVAAAVSAAVSARRRDGAGRLTGRRARRGMVGRGGARGDAATTQEAEGRAGTRRPRTEARRDGRATMANEICGVCGHPNHPTAKPLHDVFKRECADDCAVCKRVRQEKGRRGDIEDGSAQP